MPRKTYTSKEKLNILSAVEQGLAEGKSLRSLARSFDVQPKQLRNWKNNKTALLDSRSSAKTTNAGRKSALLPVEEDLLRWFFEMREQGMGVSVRMMVSKASELMETFRHSTAHSKDQVMRRFLNKHKIAIRAQTHESQRSPREVEAEALDFMNVMRPKLSVQSRHQDFILNIDQTPFFYTNQFNLSSKRMTIHGGMQCNIDYLWLFREVLIGKAVNN